MGMGLRRPTPLICLELNPDFGCRRFKPLVAVVIISRTNSDFNAISVPIRTFVV